MIALIDLYQKELLKVNGFSPSTVETYTLSINAFCRFAKNELQIDPVNVSGQQLLKWILYLKNTGIGHSRIENHHYALKSFFAFVQKTGIIDINPAEALPLLITRKRQVTRPISTKDAFKLLDSFDQSAWTGLRDYIIVSIFWALGLRTSELTGLKVRDFEPGHGKRIGLLRMRGKNKKQRALFVVDRLFDALLCYLAHPQSPNKKPAPLFPADTKTTAISNSRVQRIVKDHGRKADIQSGVTPRVLRHCFATEMYHQNVPLSAIQAMMGHDSIADTSIYIHVSDKLKQLALDSIQISRRFSWQ
ncbi:MAG: tyrosine-type recombinase/integrase [Deltaproteobacteria bacterium]|nr:tyrosine-type recombinase/integrase [Deltaproteobacteria bacterium]MBW2202028.1 tyrosine-type recombinase/integrase [Deltaproteobacteria bacterium]